MVSEITNMQTYQYIYSKFPKKNYFHPESIRGYGGWITILGRGAQIANPNVN